MRNSIRKMEDLSSIQYRASNEGGIKLKKSKLKNKDNVSYLLLTIPAVIIFTIFFTYPALSGLFYSLTDWNGIGNQFTFVGLDNYLKLFSDVRARHSFVFTLEYSVLLTIFVTVIAMGLALALSGRLPEKVRVFFRSIYFFPAVLSLIVVGLVWNQIMFQALPVIGKSLHIEFLSHNLLGNPKTAMGAVLFVNIWQGISVPLVLFLAGLQSIPSDVYEAAKIDGAGPFQTFFKITMPFLMPVFNVVFVLVFKSGLTVFDYIVSMTDGGPARSTESVGLLIYNQGFSEMRYGFALAESTLLLIVIAIVSLIQFKISSKYEVGQA